jgi:hypothetical protein
MALIAAAHESVWESIAPITKGSSSQGALIDLGNLWGCPNKSQGFATEFQAIWVATHRKRLAFDRCRFLNGMFPTPV